MSYQIEKVCSKRQSWLFLAMQLTLLAVLLWITSTVLTRFLSTFFSKTTVEVFVVLSCLFTILWQAFHIYLTLSMRRAVLVDRTMPTGLSIAMATTLVPSREFELLAGKLEGMARVDACGNHLDHWVLDEEDDPRVHALIDEFNRRYANQGVRFHHFTRKGIERYNEKPSGRWFKTFQARQKGGNINAWLDATQDAGYDLITFLDLDHVPLPDFYRKVLPYFHDREVAFVQGPETFHNHDRNFITRAASLERDTFFGLIHRMYFGIGMPIIVGAHTTFRAEVFGELGGHYPVHLTEDYLIMLRLRALHKRGIYVDEVLAVGELPATWSAYLGQQQRWASGGLDLLLRYLPRLWSDFSFKEKLFGLVLLNYYIWGTFFILSKFVLFVFLMGGVTLYLDTPLVAGILIFMLASLVLNHLWDRQFFIEPGKRIYLLENAIMNNFLGGLYFLSLVKAAFKPNTPFNVTSKSHAQGKSGITGFSYPLASGVLLFMEIIALSTAWAWAGSGEAAVGGGYNILVFPLVLSAAANLFVLAAFRKHEGR